MQNTLQIGQREKLKVIRGPGHFFDNTERQQWAWKTCLQLSYIKRIVWEINYKLLFVLFLILLFFFLTDDERKPVWLVQQTELR